MHMILAGSLRIHKRAFVGYELMFANFGNTLRLR